MEFKELKNKSESELQRLLEEERDKLREMRFKVAQRQLKRVKDIQKTKKIVAQILTLLNNKEEITKKVEKEVK